MLWWIRRYLQYDYIGYCIELKLLHIPKIDFIIICSFKKIINSVNDYIIFIIY